MPLHDDTPTDVFAELACTVHTVPDSFTMPLPGVLRARLASWPHIDARTRDWLRDHFHSHVVALE